MKRLDCRVVGLSARMMFGRTLVHQRWKIRALAILVPPPFGMPRDLSLFMHSAWHALDASNQWKWGTSLSWCPKGESTIHMILYFVLMDITAIFEYV